MAAVWLPPESVVVCLLSLRLRPRYVGLCSSTRRGWEQNCLGWSLERHPSTLHRQKRIGTTKGPWIMNLLTELCRLWLGKLSSSALLTSSTSCHVCPGWKGSEVGQSTLLEFNWVDTGLVDSKNTTLHIRQKLLLFELEHSTCNVWTIKISVHCALKMNAMNCWSSLFARNGHDILIVFCHEPGTASKRWCNDDTTTSLTAFPACTGSCKYLSGSVLKLAWVKRRYVTTYPRRTAEKAYCS